MIKREGHIGTRAPRVLLSGGGTGGHVYPAIAIADAVKRNRPDAVIAFAGSRDRIEWTAVPRAGYPIHAVSVQGFQRRLTLKNLTLPIALARGLVQSWNLVEAFDADVAVGTGGYVSAPVIWAAHLRNRPVLIQEQNAHVGVTNRILARFSDRIHTAFRETLETFPADRTVLSGNPTRKKLLNVDPDEARAYFEVEQGQRVLLVLGGSGGGRAINRAVESQHRDILEDTSVVLIWQTGARYFDRIAGSIESHPRLRIRKFIDRMDYAYAVSDLAVCRSGALTCSELLTTGTPSILVPSPNVAADHQTRNAQSLVSMGAGAILSELDMRTGLFDLWSRLWNDADRLKRMAGRAAENGTPDAADRIAIDVLELAATRSR